MMTETRAQTNDHAVVHDAPRRILMVADPIGGVWSYSLELARGLSGYGVEIALATMGLLLSCEQRREVTQEKNLTLYESVERYAWMDNPGEDAERSGDWLLALEAKLSPDLVHLNGFVHASLPWQCPCIVVVHSCMLSWWQAVRKQESPVGFEPYRRLVAKGLAAADLVVVPTAAMLDSVRKLYLPLPAAKVIHPTRSRIRFMPGKKEEFILSVGRLQDDAKNIDTLAGMAHDLPWPVYLAGDQGAQGAQEGGRSYIDGVSRLGRLAPESLAPWYAAASIYALPARYEPLGLTVLEAGLSGCALVLGDIPSLRELWEGAAAFVDPDDPEALRRELRALCADKVRLACLGEKALARSRSINASGMAAGYLAAYRQLLAESRQPEQFSSQYEPPAAYCTP